MAEICGSDGASPGARILITMRTFWAKIRALFTGRRTIGDDLAEEIEAHLQMEIDENLSHGMPPGEAQRAARRDLGNATRIRENACETWTFGALENFFRDEGIA